MRFPQTFRVARSSRGFSMVEILVTTAIMGILAALLMGSLKGVSNRGKEAACTSNLRQVSIGLTTYAAENDGNLPWASVKDTSKMGADMGLGGDWMWSKQLGPYIPQRAGGQYTARQNEVFVCPAANYGGLRGKSISSSYTCTSTFYYFTSSASLGAAGGDYDIPRRKLVGIENPSKTILVVDGKQSTGQASCPSSVRWDQAQGDLTASSPSGMTYLDYRHGDKMNVIYADGHSGTLLFKDRSQIARSNWEGRNY